MEAAASDAAARRGDALAVVIPALDEEQALPRCLASLGLGPEAAARAPEDRPDDVVVADGGSADRTLAVARALGARVVPAPRGRGVQLARGAREARGALLCFLHADAVLEPGALAAVRAAFADPALVAAGMRQRIEDDARIFRWIERAADARARRGRVYGDSALCARRADYEAAGGFADVPLFEDLDLARRLRRRGAVRLVEGAVVRVSARRWREEGPLSRTARNWALTAAWALGADPATLERHYRPRRARRPGGAEGGP